MSCGLVSALIEGACEELIKANQHGTWVLCQACSNHGIVIQLVHTHTQQTGGMCQNIGVVNKRF